jgi:hypothetical protein
MLNIINHKGNANQNDIEFYLTPVRIAIINNTHNKKETPTLLVEM